jgi:hypothetical protein
MAPKRYPEGVTVIPKGEILEHILLSVLRDASMDLPGIPAWLTAGVQKEPIQIFDINGSILFFDFAIKKGTEILGYVRAGADKVLGFPRIAYEMGPRYWDFDVAVKKLTPRVRKEYPSWILLGTKLVCYSYPKLGVMFEAVNERGEASRLIFDVADFSLIPEKPPRAQVEGAYAWSFYGSLTEDIRKISLKRFEQFDKWRLEIPEGLRKEIMASRTLLPYVERVKWPLKKTSTKLLQYCTHYAYNEARSHHCFVLHAQQKNDYCAVATCQMNLCYYRYYYSQDDIAPALNYAPGGCPSDQSPGYEQLSCNHLDATFDSSPTWEKARDQIDALHPLKSGISGHARACAGYSYVWWLFGGITEKKLYIYDPWPWNADYKLGGAVYWEDWDSITHTNYVFTRLLCP